MRSHIFRFTIFFLHGPWQMCDQKGNNTIRFPRSSWNVPRETRFPSKRHIWSDYSLSWSSCCWSRIKKPPPVKGKVPSRSEKLSFQSSYISANFFSYLLFEGTSFLSVRYSCLFGFCHKAKMQLLMQHPQFFVHGFFSNYGRFLYNWVQLQPAEPNGTCVFGIPIPSKCKMCRKPWDAIRLH